MLYEVITDDDATLRLDRSGSGGTVVAEGAGLSEYVDDECESSDGTNRTYERELIRCTRCAGRELRRRGDGDVAEDDFSLMFNGDATVCCEFMRIQRLEYRNNFV